MAADPRTTIVVPLPDGRYLALATDELDAALARAERLGYGRAIPGAVPPEEPLRTSQQEAALLGIGDVKLEGMAARDEVPCVRIGRALRFRHSDVLRALQERKK